MAKNVYIVHGLHLSDSGFEMNWLRHSQNMELLKKGDYDYENTSIATSQIESKRGKACFIMHCWNAAQMIWQLFFSEI